MASLWPFDSHTQRSKGIVKDLSTSWLCLLQDCTTATLFRMVCVWRALTLALLSWAWFNTKVHLLRFLLHTSHSFRICSVNLVRTAQELDKMAAKENYCGTIFVDHLKALLSFGKKTEPNWIFKTRTEDPNMNRIFKTGTESKPSNTWMVLMFLYLE